MSSETPPNPDNQPGEISAARFRKVLGTYPTGVCIITSIVDGIPCGMTVGTFVSISLDPPLVGFLPITASRSWIEIKKSGRFCVNVLNKDQGELCMQFAKGSDEKFSGISHETSPGGLPILDDALSWIECRIVSSDEVGDHCFVVGHVEAMETQGGAEPLIFHAGRLRSLNEC